MIIIILEKVMYKLINNHKIKKIMKNWNTTKLQLTSIYLDRNNRFIKMIT